MKSHSTNYYNTFIQIADDCPALSGETPVSKKESPTVASMQFEMIQKHPYQYTSDEIIFTVFADRKDLSDSERPQAKIEFFSKGQPCLRASALGKRYGWGIHHDSEGKVAIYSSDSEMYHKLSSDPSLKIVKAMKSSR
ncbi:MAG TPA: DUF6157 family protein [Bacteroidia bacterium]